MATYTLRKILYLDKEVKKFSYSADNLDSQNEQSSMSLKDLAHLVAHSDFTDSIPKSQFKDVERIGKPAEARANAYIMSDALSREEFISFVCNYLDKYNELKTNQLNDSKREVSQQ